jgi:hypothetical protein
MLEKLSGLRAKVEEELLSLEVPVGRLVGRKEG